MVREYIFRNEQAMTPIVSIVGLSGCGKTTYIEKLIAELKNRGYCVASVKHAQEIHFEAGKDSERHLDAGSGAVVVAAPERLVMITKAGSGESLAQAARMLGDEYDLIVAEGFKQADAPKIVLRREGFELPLENLKRVAAVATDMPLPGGIRQFPLQDIKKAADFIEEGFIKPREERMALYVNGEAVPLIAFPRQMMIGMLKGMVSSLKGVGEINKIEILLSAGKACGGDKKPTR
jgi:molybdopterin-guanine dinucleotide biosynthesis adapter protein